MSNIRLGRRDNSDSTSTGVEADKVTRGKGSVRRGSQSAGVTASGREMEERTESENEAPGCHDDLRGQTKRSLPSSEQNGEMIRKEQP